MNLALALSNPSNLKFLNQIKRISNEFQFDSAPSLLRNCFQKQNHIREWLKQFENKETGNPSLNKAIIRVFGLQYCLLGIVFAFEGFCLKILQPLCLSWLIR